MKKIVLTKITVIALLMIISNPILSKTGNLSVNGSATIFVEPDIVTLDLYTQQSDESATGANQKISDTMEKMLEIARNAHILDKDLSTGGITISAYRQPNNGCSNLNHQARQTLRLVIRDLDQTVGLIDLMVGAGALVQNVQPGVSNVEAQEDKALELAVNNARRQANTAASQLGLKVGKPIAVNFSSGIIHSDLSGISSGMAFVTAQASSPKTYVPGKIPVHQSVQVVFESKDR